MPSLSLSTLDEGATSAKGGDGGSGASLGGAAQQLVRPPVRFRFDPVTPGVAATRTFSVYNDTPVTLPFRWHLAGFVEATAGSRRRSQARSGAGGGGGGGGATARSAVPTARTQATHATQQSSAAHGGEAGGDALVQSSGPKEGVVEAAAAAFAVEPAHGQLAPHAAASFTVTFQPNDVSLSEVVARLKIDGVPKDPRKLAILKAEKEALAAAQAQSLALSKLEVVQEGKASEPAAAAGPRESQPGSKGSDSKGVDQEEDGEGKAAAEGEEVARPSTPPIEREEVVGLTVFLQGAGREAEVLLQPAFVAVPGTLTTGKLSVHRVRLVNHGNATTAFQWGEPQRAIDLNTSTGPVGVIDDAEVEANLDGSSVPVPTVPPPDTISGEVSAQDVAASSPLPVTVNPASGTVPPGSTVEVEVSFAAMDVGSLDVVVPCYVEHGPANGVPLRLTANVVGPRVRILEPEVDFGLIGVGKRSEQVVHFVNLSDAPATWSFQQTAKALLAPSPSPWLKSTSRTRPNSSMFGADTADGTPRSVMSGVGGLAVEKREQAVLLFEPSYGSLPPHGSAEVRVVCAAGSKPQRLREMFQCMVHNGNTAYARVRGEVQSPKVYLDTLDLPLRTTFTDVPVRRTVKLTNLSNLDAAWKWDQSLNQVENTAMHVTFEPSSGTLGPKAVQEVAITFLPQRPARVDICLICDVRGMAYPLGVGVTATIKGLVVAFSVKELANKAKKALEDIPEGEDAGKEGEEGEGEQEGEEVEELALTDPALIAEKQAMEEAAEAGAEVGVMPGINFGNDFKTFSSRTITMRVHNLSGIPTRFSASVKNYKTAEQVEEEDGMEGDFGEAGGYGTAPHRPAAPPQPPPSRRAGNGAATAGGRASASLSRGARTFTGTGGPRTRSRMSGTTGTATLGGGRRKRQLLGVEHEGRDKFQSEAGLTMLRNREYKEKMRRMLALKRGVAFEISPAVAEVPEWGTVEVTVTCVGDMPGKYRDELVIEIDGLEDSRLPIRVGVVGSPLQFMDNTVGLLVRKRSAPLPPACTVLCSATHTMYAHSFICFCKQHTAWSLDADSSVWRRAPRLWAGGKDVQDSEYKPHARRLAVEAEGRLCRRSAGSDRQVSGCVCLLVHVTNSWEHC